MFKHILISTDGSPISSKAAKAGIALASALGAKVTAYCALEQMQPLYAEGYAFDQEVIDGIEKRVRGVGQKHVDAIAAKYILPDEGTYDFALMYVPAENVYYETIIKEDVGEDRQLFSYALAKRVIPVSPNSFYAYIQTILLGLRGLKVEERAQEILGELSRLRGDFQKIQENFRVLGRHLNNAAGSYSETDKTMTKLDAKLSQIEQPVLQTETTEAPTLPL